MTIAWSEELVNDICDHVAAGRSLIEVGKLKGYPSERVLYLRMAQDEEFCRRIARAREAQQDREADIIVKMADEADSENWQQVKLRIDARKWRAAKLAPKRYGDKVQVGGDPDGAPLQIIINKP